MHDSNRFVTLGQVLVAATISMLLVPVAFGQQQHAELADVESEKPRTPAVLRTPPAEAILTFYDKSFENEFQAFEKSFRSERGLLKRKIPPTALKSITNIDEKSGFRTVNSCLQLANLPDAEIDVSLGLKHQPEVAYQSCLTLAIARFGVPSKQSFFEHNRIGDDLFRTLRVYGLHSELSQRTDVNEETMLKDVSVHELQVTRSSIVLEQDLNDGAGMTIRIDILASADFDEDGFEDLLAEYSERSWTGSFFTSRPLVISRKSQGGKLEFKADDFPATCLRSCRKLYSENGNTAKKAD